MFGFSQNAKGAHNAILAQQTLTEKELTLHEIESIELGSAIADVFALSGLDIEYEDIYKMFNSKPRYIQLNIIAMAFCVLRKAPNLAGENWEDVKNPFVLNEKNTKDIQKIILKLSTKHNKVLSIPDAKLNLSNWGLYEEGNKRVARDENFDLIRECVNIWEKKFNDTVSLYGDEFQSHPEKKFWATDHQIRSVLEIYGLTATLVERAYKLACERNSETGEDLDRLHAEIIEVAVKRMGSGKDDKYVVNEFRAILGRWKSCFSYGENIRGKDGLFTLDNYDDEKLLKMMKFITLEVSLPADMGRHLVEFLKSSANQITSDIASFMEEKTVVKKPTDNATLFEEHPTLKAAKEYLENRAPIQLEIKLLTQITPILDSHPELQGNDDFGGALAELIVRHNLMDKSKYRHDGKYFIELADLLKKHISNKDPFLVKYMKDVEELVSFINR